ncbi:MAG: TrkH family potassium uptake protein [Candidatus Endonucleobacter sp. (ex Gigantidas childressi)]|nr:TrkH family potassium uptake protein [Candidatus Endonucleobacter sp. (ex Gigantidas childressi)]
MSIRPVLYVVGLFLTVLAALMLLPALYHLITKEGSASAFLLSAGITGGSGGALFLSAKPENFSLKPREAFLLTNCCWLILSAYAAIPFSIELQISYSDAFFETMSGITTTGSTVLTGLDNMEGGILLWRSLLQWLGGIGFIVMAVAVLPFLKVGGMRLFKSESSDWSEKVMPRSGSIAKRIVFIYIGLTITCAYLYFLAGMSGFEAINHAMSTLSTGGYSTSDSSMAHFSSSYIHWIAILFMILGGLPFVLFVKFVHGDIQSIIKDSQVRALIGFLLIIWLAFSLWLALSSNYSFWESLTLVAFNTTSVVTTTGYALTDYTLWGGFSAALFLFLSLVGGCSGSTAGGIKIFRFQIGARLLGIQLKQLTHPRACFIQSYNGQLITDDILRSLIGFGFFFALLTTLVTLLLCLLGLDLITSLSGAITAISNVGPGLGDIIGPAGNFADIPDSAKWILSWSMLMGRLEITTVLVLFTATFWRA